MAQRLSWDEAVADERFIDRTGIEMEEETDGTTDAAGSDGADPIEKGIYFLLDDSCIVRLNMRSNKRA